VGLLEAKSAKSPSVELELTIQTGWPELFYFLDLP
jgi:hypothetical protein